jgi:hypothetical protein
MAATRGGAVHESLVRRSRKRLDMQLHAADTPFHTAQLQTLPNGTGLPPAATQIYDAPAAAATPIPRHRQSRYSGR